MRKFIAIATLLGASIGVAQAHTSLQSSIPAANSTLAAAPSRFVLTFHEATRLTALAVQKDGGPEQKVAPLPKVAAAKIAVDAPSLDAGHYMLSWRAVGDDGHTMSGKLAFSIAAK